MAASPAITDDSWGRVEADGQTFKDVKLWPGGCRGWDWNETGTSHDAGVQPSDVAEVLDHGATHVIIGLGRERRLRVAADTEALLDDRAIACEALATDGAIARYDELRRGGTAVGALIHSTC